MNIRRGHALLSAFRIFAPATQFVLQFPVGFKIFLTRAVERFFFLFFMKCFRFFAAQGLTCRHDECFRFGKLMPCFRQTAFQVFPFTFLFIQPFNLLLQLRRKMAFFFFNLRQSDFAFRKGRVVLLRFGSAAGELCLKLCKPAVVFALLQACQNIPLFRKDAGHLFLQPV